LLARHGTRAQAGFFLRQRGQRLEKLARRDDEHRHHHQQVLAGVPPEWRRASIQRQDLERIGLNPQPHLHPGVLVPHPPDAAGELMRDLQSGRARTERHTMVRATLDDRQTLTALNEIFVGHSSHQSARYTIALAECSERQSSSGVIVATGTGATGWAASVHLERGSTLQLPGPAERALAFFVREPWPSPATETTIAEGTLREQDALTITSEFGDGAVVFGDGIETDRIRLERGQRVEIAIADRALHLVR
jgi:hypothetical protein